MMKAKVSDPTIQMPPTMSRTISPIPISNASLLRLKLDHSSEEYWYHDAED